MHVLCFSMIKGYYANKIKAWVYAYMYVNLNHFKSSALQSYVYVMHNTHVYMYVIMTHNTYQVVL